MQLTSNTVLYEMFNCSMFMYCFVYRPNSLFLHAMASRRQFYTSAVNYAHTAGKSALCNLCIQPTHASKPSSKGPAVCKPPVQCLSVCLSALSLSTSPVTPVQPLERGRMQCSCPAPGTRCAPLQVQIASNYHAHTIHPPRPALPDKSVSVSRQLYCN